MDDITETIEPDTTRVEEVRLVSHGCGWSAITSLDTVARTIGEHLKGCDQP